MKPADVMFKTSKSRFFILQRAVELLITLQQDIVYLMSLVFITQPATGQNNGRSLLGSLTTRRPALAQKDLELQHVGGSGIISLPFPQATSVGNGTAGCWAISDPVWWL